ncbi:polysaccharide pyruvyl transferase family protein [Oxalobacteraceae bacterium A2-2]
MNTADLISQLQARAEAELSPYIRRGQKVAIIDFPHHANAGDSYIWLGETAYLRRAGADLVYVCWDQAYDPERIKEVLGRDGLILFHGGGNFGDRWPAPHELRLKVLRDFRGHRVLQFPQTVHFDHAANVEETARAIAEHGDFIVLVRDQTSLEFVRKHFDCPVALSPDMAFFIGPCQMQAPSLDGYVLARSDIESAGPRAVVNLPLASLPGRWERGDWLGSDWLETKLANRFCRHNLEWNRSAVGARMMVWLSDQAAATRLRRGIRQLSQGKLILTDRLHVHILCLLLNKPHVVLDNDYGKISSFYRAWTHPTNLASFASDFDDAIAKVSGAALVAT